MAILPLAGRHILTTLTSDLGMHPPTYTHDTDVRGLVTVTVVVELTRTNDTPLEKNFTSLPEDNLLTAEDVASRMALRYIHTYNLENHRVSNYFNPHVFVRWKKDWTETANRLAQQLDIARTTIRRLHNKLYQNNLDHNTLKENLTHFHILETLQTGTQMQELTNQISKQHCQILLLQNRVNYLDNMSTVLCIHHQGLLQLPTTQFTPTSTNSVVANIHENGTTSSAPLPTARASLTEL